MHFSIFGAQVNCHETDDVACGFLVDFHGLDGDVLKKALRTLETQNKAELMSFDGNEGVKFF